MKKNIFGWEFTEENTHRIECDGGASEMSSEQLAECLRMEKEMEELKLAHYKKPNPNFDKIFEPLWIKYIKYLRQIEKETGLMLV